MTDIHAPDPARPPHAHRPRASDEVWEGARADFLGGMTGDEAARRHGLGIDNFWKHAREEEWLRKHQPPPSAPEHDDALDLDAPPEDRERMIDKAWRRVSIALDRGRSTEAMRWMRLHAMLVAAARDEVREAERISAEEMRSVTRVAQGIQAQAAATLRHVQAETLAYSGRDDVDPPADNAPKIQKVQSKNSAPADEPFDPLPRPLTRAERRRRDALKRRR